jgi:predicted PurR-regulated permease PerM
VQWLSRYIPRGVAIAIVFLATIALLSGLITALGLEVLQQGQSLIGQISEVLRNQDFIELPFENFLEMLNFDRILQALQTGLISGLGIAQNLFSSAFSLIFLLVITVYMLIDGAKIWLNCLRLLPLDIRDRFAFTFQRSFLGFLRGQITLVIFLSSLSFLTFALLGVRYALLFALIVGILDAIPGIGATLGILVITLLILVSQGWQLALTVLVACIVLQQIQDNIVNPRVMGEALQINPVFLFLALFTGERIAGLLGIFLAIPIAGMIAAWIQCEQEIAASRAVDSNRN